MTTSIERAVVFGAGSGVGRATALALARQGARVWAVARTAEHLASLQREAALETIVGDATDPAVVERALSAADPGLVVVSVGTRPRMGPIEDQTWDSFS